MDTIFDLDADIHSDKNQEKLEKQQWKRLTALLARYQAAYDRGEPIVDDDVYDDLFMQLKALEVKYGVLPDSPTNITGYAEGGDSSDKNVGAIKINGSDNDGRRRSNNTRNGDGGNNDGLVRDAENIKHLQHMLSLDQYKVAQMTDLDISTGISFFMQKINRFLGTDRFYPLICEPKVDGISISLRYEDGKLQTAALRGDGIEGENVLQNILRMKGIPLTIDIKQKIEIRGELFMSNSTYMNLQAQGITFASTRHAVSGSTRLIDSNVFAERGLELVIHGFAAENYDYPFNTYQETMQWLISQKFTTFCFKDSDGSARSSVCCGDDDNVLKADTYFYSKVAHSLEEAVEYFKELGKARDGLSYGLDGAVFKLNELGLYKTLLYSRKYPRYAFAVKFPSKSKTSPIKGVKWQVGRTGIITPVVEIETVHIDGSNISNITMHNVSEYERHSPQIGDIAVIEKAGDVIPAIVNIIHTGANGEKDERIDIEVPVVCPSCGSVLIRDSKVLMCTNNECKAVLLAKLEHAYSRDCLNIEGLAEQKIVFLFDRQLVKKPVDIFTLEQTCINRQISLESLPNWGRKSLQNLLAQIEKARNISFDRFLFSLGIEGLGKRMSEKLASVCANWMELIKYLETDEQILGLGEQIKRNLLLFHEKEYETVVKELLMHINIQKYEEANTAAVQYKNIKVVFTGKFSMSRQGMKELAQARGVQVFDAISGSIHYLIYGTDPSSKLKKAQGLGIECLSELDWKKKLEEI